jgi:hypothetical protein
MVAQYMVLNSLRSKIILMSVDSSERLMATNEALKRLIERSQHAHEQSDEIAWRTQNVRARLQAIEDQLKKLTQHTRSSPPLQRPIRRQRTNA